MRMVYAWLLLMSSYNLCADLDAAVVCTHPDLSIPVIECEALVALYNAADGENWSGVIEWGSTPDVGAWDGVTVENGHVVRLSRGSGFSEYMRGTIPVELGNLSELRVLYLSGVQLIGTIPPELGNLTQVERFTIGGTSISGTIPSTLGNLNNVQELDLTNNLLIGPIPPELGDLPQLEELFLAANKFTGSLTPELGNLSQLTRIVIDQNHFTGTLPDNFVNLTDLFVLSIESNHFNADEFGQALIPSSLASWFLTVSVRSICCQTAAPINLEPIITGYPDQTAFVNEAYQFEPFAHDPNVGDTLTFSISNQPIWADFDVNTGILSGIPMLNDAGSYPDVIIGVSDGLISVSLPAFSIDVDVLFQNSFEVSP
ncbi:putative Ig domain-containing protein [Marinicella sp. W31]|uniref:putative Ig domain-containing protein n=1 Tax=Marinicella sp. W31 TaxID=3023713 RepID=UPI00375722E3